MSLKSFVNGVAVATMAAATVVAAPSAEARDWKRGNHSESHNAHNSGGGRHSGGGGVTVNRWGDVRGSDHSQGRGSFAHGRGQRWNGGYENSRGHDRSYSSDYSTGRHSGSGKRDHTARNVAIGAFAAVLGLALAAESQRVREEYYDERD
jgi:hypothetical protein